VAGAEIAELYISQLSSPVMRPVKELKGFNKVFLKKGETKRITITLDESAFSYYKVKEGHFGFDSGKFKLLVGGSSRNMALAKTITIHQYNL
jgi:beta-glucosidase